MLRGSLAVLSVLVAFAGCSGDGGLVGALCGGNDDCAGTLQCLHSHCELRCVRAPDCGDGYSCDDQGLCQAAISQDGAACMSEVDCAAGLSCQLDGAAVDRQGRLLASCAAEGSGRAAGSPCAEDGDCRNGTCALGQCIDLCRQTRDCASGLSCLDVPRIEANGAQFNGCLPPGGQISWSIPVNSSSQEILLPVPTTARSAALVMSVDDAGQKVGAESVLTPSGSRIYDLPCSPQLGDPLCTQTVALDEYYANQLRHQPTAEQSVLLIPSSPSMQLEHGAYKVRVSAFRQNGAPGTAIPRVTAVLELKAQLQLQLHFFFLELDDHPCVSLPNNAKLDKISAAQPSPFQSTYLVQLRAVFTRAGLDLVAPTFDDITDHPELDGLAVADAGKLLALGESSTGINVFFVRSLSPLGIQAIGPNPGPVGIGGTTQSGIVIGLDTLCYRDWTQLARLTAHEIARYMGLYHNVELETGSHPTWRDPIDDSNDSSDNLMFFSELGGTELSAGQQAMLKRSAVLQ